MTSSNEGELLDPQGASTSANSYVADTRMKEKQESNAKWAAPFVVPQVLGIILASLQADKIKCEKCSYLEVGVVVTSIPSWLIIYYMVRRFICAWRASIFERYHLTDVRQSLSRHGLPIPKCMLHLNPLDPLGYKVDVVGEIFILAFVGSVLPGLFVYALLFCQKQACVRANPPVAH